MLKAYKYSEKIKTRNKMTDLLINEQTNVINWKNVQGKECLVLTYDEFLSSNEIMELIQSWLEENVNKISNSFNLVFDCKTSVNYQRMLEVYWKNFIVKIKSTE